VGSATSDSGNGGTQSLAAAVTLVSGTVGGLTLVASVSGYNSYADGAILDTYTVAVVQDSIDGVLQTATLKVTSASGKDDALAIAAGELNVYFPVGHRGLELKFTDSGELNASTSADDLVVGDVWHVVVHDKYVAVTPTSGGTYTGAADTEYIVRVSRGGTFAGTPPQVTVTTTTGVDAAPPFTLAAIGTSIPLGTLGGTLTLAASMSIGLRYGDTWYVPVVASKPGRYGTLILGNSLPAALLSATDVELHLALEKNIQVPQDVAGTTSQTNWSQSATILTLDGSLEATDPSLTSGGVLVPTPVVAGEVFVQYRAWRQELVGQIGTISDAGDLATAIPGDLTPDNPLAWGVYLALQNANGTDVKFTAVADPTSQPAWEAVLELLVGRTDVYNLVPLTYDPTILGLYAAHVAAQSSPTNDGFGGLFVGLQVAAQAPVVSPATSTNGNQVLATITQAIGSSPPVYTVVQVPAQNANFLRNGVRVGDIVRALYSTAFGQDVWSEFTVAAVVSEDELVLAAGPAAPVSVAARIEVWHPRTKDEEAAAIAAAASAYASRRTCAVWPDQVGVGGTTFPGYFVGCALAGLASGVVPQQGLTHYPIVGFDDLSRTAYFNATQLDTLVGGGAWVVFRDLSGTVKTLRAVTTDTSSLDAIEEMIRRNLDSISYYFAAVLAPFIGVTNVVPSALARIHTEMVSAISYLQTAGFTEVLGGQLGQLTQLVSIQPNATLADHVSIQVACDLPMATNVIQLFLNA
jgi:hypothetical protein